MKLSKKKNKKRIRILLDWLLHIILYTIAFILITSLFKSVYVDQNHQIIWSSIIVLVLYILNKTIKPILVTLTIPITGITLGLFYPFINVLILYITDILLGNHFQINSIVIAIILACLFSISNFIVNELIKKIMDKVKRK